MLVVAVLAGPAASFLTALPGVLGPAVGCAASTGLLSAALGTASSSSLLLLHRSITDADPAAPPLLALAKVSAS